MPAVSPHEGEESEVRSDDGGVEVVEDFGRLRSGS